MASMWKPLLAATLAVGRNTRLLTVGSSILAMNAPMLPPFKGPQLSSAHGSSIPTWMNILQRALASSEVFQWHNQ